MLTFIVEVPIKQAPTFMRKPGNRAEKIAKRKSASGKCGNFNSLPAAT